MPDQNNNPEAVNVDANSFTRRLWSEKDWLNMKLGRYKIKKLLGHGGMGRVFLARDMILQRNVAIKTMPQSFEQAQISGRLNQFLREAQAVARLEHPHIIRVYDIITDNNVLAIAMEFVANGTLGELVMQNKILPVKTACQVVAQAALGLSYAHRKGVIHRDIKPGNLMLTEDNVCKVVDFGAAAMQGKSELKQLIGKAIGTPYYIPPELVRGQLPTVKSDIYSLGAVLWYALTGKPVFTGKTIKELHLKHLKNLPCDIRILREDVPQVLGDAIAKALKKKAVDRFENMKDFAELLWDFIQDRPVFASSLTANPELTQLRVAMTNSPVAPHGRPEDKVEIDFDNSVKNTPELEQIRERNSMPEKSQIQVRPGYMNQQWMTTVPKLKFRCRTRCKIILLSLILGIIFGIGVWLFGDYFTGDSDSISDKPALVESDNDLTMPGFDSSPSEGVSDDKREKTDDELDKFINEN